jgi:single-stranded-DNA-specific exonuclease
VDRPWIWPSMETAGAAEDLSRAHGMPRPVAWTLARRGWAESAPLGEFLNPRLDRLADPSGMADMDRAVLRVIRAIDGGETLFVHGDYDVDGITGTAFLTRTLRALAARVVPFIPGREDGYGLGARGIEAARTSGAAVLITVDTGIRAFEPIERAQAEGLDVVVLDHHEPADRLPNAFAVVNPLRGEAGGPFRSLAAVGVAAKFMHALALRRPSSALKAAYRDALQLVALGTIADMVPLTGENRILVSHGLQQLSRSEWAGVKALKAIAGLSRNRVTAADVAFFLGPRLNAAGRMGSAVDALRLLLAEDPLEAYRLAENMDAMNRERRRVEATMTGEALDAVRVLGEVPPALVLWSETWSRGLIGVVASRLLERFGRPVFLIALDGNSGRGSARSIPGFPLPEALEHCDDLLLEHGGHAEAAGFSIAAHQLEAFRERILERARTAQMGEPSRPLEIDAAVELEEMNLECLSWLDRLSPFGRGNPEPLFGLEGGILVEPPSVVGKQHLRLTVGQGKARMRAIAFRQGSRVTELDRGQKVDLAFHAAPDDWRGREAVELVVRDLRPR